MLPGGAPERATPSRRRDGGVLNLWALALLELLAPEPDLVLDRARLLAQFGRYVEARAALAAYREAGGQHPDGAKLEQWLGARMTGR